MGKSDKSKEQTKKRMRKRKLNLYDSIRKQMEFYFSTPNLQKDRFLKKLVQTDPEGFVDADVFLKFNKILSFTSDISCILKAIKESELLITDESNTKVGRKIKYEEPFDTDKRTVYAEFLPKDVTIEWLIKHFSQAEKVVHVSLPKFKSTGDPKGFAFIEFETIEGAARACELLNFPPEQSSNTKPGMFAKTFKSGKHMKKPLTTQGNQKDENAVKTEKDQHGSNDGVVCNTSEVMDASSLSGPTEDGHKSKSDQRKKKKRRQTSQSEKSLNEVEPSEEVEMKSKQEVVGKKNKRNTEDCDLAPPAKVRKLDREPRSSDPPENSAAKNQECTPTKKKSKAKKGNKNDEDVEGKAAGAKTMSEDADRSMEFDQSMEECSKDEKEKKMGKKKIKQLTEAPSVGMRVISKTEWMAYRQEYYQKHKQNMTDLKMKVREINANQEYHENKFQGNFNNGNSEDKTEADAKPKDEGLNFVPCVIVKVTTSNPVSKKFLKERLSESGKVAFLDMNDGDLTAFARCADAESAAAIIKTSSGDCQYTLLNGDEEKTHWDKIFSDREKRLASKSKKKGRGRDKILAKADQCLKNIKEKNTRIVFDD